MQTLQQKCTPRKQKTFPLPFDKCYYSIEKRKKETGFFHLVSGFLKLGLSASAAAILLKRFRMGVCDGGFRGAAAGGYRTGSTRTAILYYFERT